MVDTGSLEMWPISLCCHPERIGHTRRRNGELMAALPGESEARAQLEGAGKSSMEAARRRGGALRLCSLSSVVHCTCWGEVSNDGFTHLSVYSGVRPG